MDGWVFDEKCVARQSDIKGNHLPLDKIVHFEVLQDAVTSVLNGSVSISHSYFILTRILKAGTTQQFGGEKGLELNKIGSFIFPG